MPNQFGATSQVMVKAYEKDLETKRKSAVPVVRGRFHRGVLAVHIVAVATSAHHIGTCGV